MKRYLTLAAITAICIGLFCSFPALNQVQAQGKKAVSTAEKLRCSTQWARRRRSR